MSAKTRQLEIDTARWINRTSENVVAEAPSTSTLFSDVWVKREGMPPCWIEVKQDHGSNILNPRFYYKDWRWYATGEGYSAKVLEQELNASWEAKQFITEFSEYMGNPIYLTFPTSKMAQKWPGCVTSEDIDEFFQLRKNKYIMTISDYDIGTLITKDYNDRPPPDGVYYMQVANDLYMIGVINPLNFPDDMPVVEGYGDLKIRFSSRRSSGLVEVQAEIKLGELPESEYSIMPGTGKLSPFR